jgi:hypothetical protein
MEEAKLVQLHAALSAHGKGKGGLGASGSGRVGMGKAAEDATVPKNALYSRFVRAGAWDPTTDHVASTFVGTRMKFDEGEKEEATSAVAKTKRSEGTPASADDADVNITGKKRKRVQEAAPPTIDLKKHAKGHLKSMLKVQDKVKISHIRKAVRAITEEHGVEVEDEHIENAVTKAVAKLVKKGRVRHSSSGKHVKKL